MKEVGREIKTKDLDEALAALRDRTITKLIVSEAEFGADEVRRDYSCSCIVVCISHAYIVLYYCIHFDSAEHSVLDEEPLNSAEYAQRSKPFRSDRGVGERRD